MIKDIKYAVLAVTFILIIIPFGIYNFFKGDRVYSELENRNLLEKPMISLEGLWNGEYFKSYEKYSKDQTAFKDQITSSYVKLNFYGLGRDKVNGYYLGKDGRLYQDRDIDLKESIEIARKRNEYIKNLSDEMKAAGKEFYFIYAPNSSDYSAEDLPIYAKSNMEKVYKVEEEINSIKKDVDYINMREIFDKDVSPNESVVNKFYYKTDNHWNIDGAYKAYEYIVNKAKEKYPRVENPLRENEEFMVDKYYKFNGSYNRQLQFNIDSKEELKVFRPRHDILVEGKDPIEKEWIDSKYSYSIFMGGDMPRSVLRTGRKELPSVLIVGNSFTNPVETLVYTSFGQMHSIDVRDEREPRYDVADYAKENDMDIVIFIRGGI